MFDPLRDPRMHTISVTFITKIVQGNEAANDDAESLQWVNVDDELGRLIQTNKIAFDHPKILSDFKNWRKIAQALNEKNNKSSIIPTFWSTKKREADIE
jgi:ADP-ribose pyrophosphatase YjhB (NUDIX family)